MICPSCGIENKPGSIHCVGCGTQLDGLETGGTEQLTTAMPWTGETDVEEAESTGPSEPEDRTMIIDAAGDASAGETPGGGYGYRREPSQPATSMGYVFGTAGSESGTMQGEVGAGEGGPALDLPAEAPPEDDAAGVHSVVDEISGEEIEPEEPEHYVPPEADYRPEARGLPPEGQGPPAAETHAGRDSTQAIAPALGGAAAATSRPRKICPECYAPNPEQNIYCQECGSALPVISAREAATSRGQAPPAGYQQTAVLSADMIQDAGAQPAYAGAEPGREKARTARSLGVADVLAVLSIGAVAMALVPAFTWKKGIELSIFSHQGAFSPGRTDLLGGPGILPYNGVEFFTVGLLAAVGAGLALIFLAVRAGRGPMFILAGSILLLPLVYLFFQAVLPLRQMGINVQPSVGLRGIFLGNTANPGLGPPLWLISGAGVLLILAGFIAPPRGWGRLFTFLLCLSIVVGTSFFCAACYNWNLFISDAALSRGGPGLGAASLASLPPILLH